MATEQHHAPTHTGAAPDHDGAAATVREVGLDRQGRWALEVTESPARPLSVLVGLSPPVPTAELAATDVLLVTGGSQGARRINRAVAGAAPDLAEAGVQVLVDLVWEHPVTRPRPPASWLSDEERAVELQRAQHAAAADAPVLLSIDTRAGHGMGKPKDAAALEFADQLAFAALHTGLQL